MSYIQLDMIDLALAGLLVLANAGLSLWLQLGLERRMLIAAARMVVQLSLVGMVLKALFLAVSPLWTGLAALAMIAFAGHEILARQDRRFGGWWAYGLGTGSMLLAAGLVTIFALTTQLRPDPWYHPQYAIPLLGMVLGNTMTGISLGLQTLTGAVVDQRVAIEARLALGVAAGEAVLPAMRKALKAAAMPIVNAMGTTGLVSLPGMMTGQILGGVDPAQAVKYQILIMFLISGGTAAGAVTAVTLGARRLFDQRQRLRLDRLG
ncbi:MAG: iron export ABC transporter permease subunit FetB [Magnetospirillum sp.]|nr:iron export ABC transporter permease subunit FetB [Magnetospirillum sp.]